VVVSNSVDSVDRVLPSDSADRSSVYNGVTPIHTSAGILVSLLVLGEMLLQTNMCL
jgi:hypothetical protein